MSRSARWWVAAVGVAVLSWGCAAHRVAPDTALPPRDVTLEELERVFAERAPGSYRALVTIAVRNGTKAASVRGTVAFTSPRTFEVRGVDPLGRDLFAFSAEGEDMRLAVSGERTPLVGSRAIETGLAPWLGPVRLDDLLRVLASTHGMVIEPLDTVALERGEDRYILYYLALSGQHARIERKVFLEGTRLLPVSEDWFDPAGDIRVHVQYGRYTNVDGVPRPMMVTAASAAGTLRVDFHEIVVGERT